MIVLKNTRVAIKIIQPSKMVISNYVTKTPLEFSPSDIIIDPVGKQGLYNRNHADFKEIGQLAWAGFYGFVFEDNTFEGVIVVHAKKIIYGEVSQMDYIKDVTNEIENPGPWVYFDFDAGVLGEGRLILHQRVIENVDENFRKKFYDFRTNEEIAEHIIYNLLVNKWELSTLDGWADLPNEFAKIEWR